MTLDIWLYACCLKCFCEDSTTKFSHFACRQSEIQMHDVHLRQLGNELNVLRAAALAELTTNPKTHTK